MRRPRLLTMLDDVLVTRLGLVVAPPGAGKTTLMAQWASASGLDVSWLRLDPEDSAPGRLAQRLFEACKDNLDVHDVPATVDEFALAVERRVEPLLLVLDDVHVIARTAADLDLERLLLLCPDRLRILIASRRRPPVNLVRSEMPRAVVVTGQDLAFGAWEVEHLFRTVYRTPLTADDAAALARRTGGWAAGLHLFHMATSDRGATDRRRAVAALDQRSRYAWDYLESQALAGLPARLREFLVRTAVFTTLTPQRCDALLGGSDSWRILAELERLCPMVASNHDGTGYACHEVLRRHLETQLQEELCPEDAHAWWCRAAGVLETAGAVTEALRARCLGEDWDGVRRLLQVRGSSLAVGEAGALTDILPSWLQEDDPWASLLAVRRLLDDGRLEAAAAAAHRTAGRLTDPVGVDLCRRVALTTRTWGHKLLAAPSTTAVAWPLIPATPTTTLLRWGALLRATTQRDPLAVVRRAEKLDVPYRDLVRGIGLLCAGDGASAKVLLGQCARDNDDNPIPALVARAALAVMDGLFGPGSAASAALDLVSAEAERHGMTWIARVTRGLAMSFLGDDDGDDAASAVIVECDLRGDPWGAALVSAGLATRRVRSGRFDVALLERLIVRWRELDAGVMEAWTRSLFALAAAVEDLPDASADAEVAQAHARLAAVPGAVSAACAALAATCSSEKREELHLAASESAIAAGMGPRPWWWVGGVYLQGQHDTGAVPEDSAPVEITPSSETVPALEVRCFGEFRLLLGGEQLDLSGLRPRARSLLRLLAVHAGRMVHREELTDTLWGDLRQEAAMHNLQVTLSSLRGVLSAAGMRGATSPIVREGNAYGLAMPDGSTCDLVVFSSAVVQARSGAVGEGDLGCVAKTLGRAMEVYTGDLLPEEGPADWAVSLRDRYRLQAAETAAALAALELRRGDAAAAVSAATRSVEIDPHQDSAWRALIQAYHLLGDLAAGERAQRKYSDVLVELGVGGGNARRVGQVIRRGRH